MKLKIKSSEKMSDEVAKLADQIIICNWFSKDTLESLTGNDISRLEYLQFKAWLEGSSMYDNCSEMVRELYQEYKEEQE